MTGREERMVLALAEAVVDPRPPMPAIADTDTLEAVGVQLASGPGVNRLGLRVVLRVLDRAAPRLAGERGSLAALPRERREAALAAAARHPLLGALLEPWRAVLHLAYYGDLGVLRTFGYDPEAVRARARLVAP